MSRTMEKTEGMSGEMSVRKLISRILHDLTPKLRQAFYEEYGRQLFKGMTEEKAIGRAFRKIGIEDPFTSMKITTPGGIFFGIRSHRK